MASDELSRSGKIPPLSAYVGLYKAVQDIGNEDMKCEHPLHDENVGGFHKGTGEWYLRGECGNCGVKSNEVALVCASYMEAVEMGQVVVHCMDCRKSMDAREYMVVLGRR